MRDTSQKAYKHIVATGILGKRRTQVYEALFQLGPLGSREIWEEIKKICTKPIPQHSINPRFKELERMGLVQQVGEHACPYTDHTVVSWDVTSKFPTKGYKAEPTKVEQLREYLLSLAEKHGSRKVGVDKAMAKVLSAMDSLGL
jgi:DNA-binding HxlR family transcriptional regulator